MLIYVDENIPQGKEAFHGFGEVAVFPGRELRNADLLRADALIVRSITRVNESLLRGTSIKFVGTATIGVDHVDQEYLARSGIGFAAAPGCNANSVGEYIVAALAYLQGKKGLKLRGKTIGVVGCGHVGSQVVRKAELLGLHVLKNDPPLQNLSLPGIGFSDLETLQDQCDIISMHVPFIRGGSHPTLKLADETFFSRFSKPVVFLNTSRGEVQDESALSLAREKGWIRNLVLDVFQNEPRVDAKICALADLVTPHIAGYSISGKLNGAGQIQKAFCHYFGLDSTWLPRVPPPPLPDIHFDSGNGGSGDVDDESLLHRCIRQAYDIELDDTLMRKALGASDPGKAFDQLRKNYRIRNEFTDFSIEDISSPRLKTTLQSLGFKTRRR